YYLVLASGREGFRGTSVLVRGLRTSGSPRRLLCAGSSHLWSHRGRSRHLVQLVRSRRVTQTLGTQTAQVPRANRASRSHPPLGRRRPPRDRRSTNRVAAIRAEPAASTTARNRSTT